MNIYTVDNNISMQGKTPNWFKKIGQKVLDLAPNRTSKENKHSRKYWDKFTYVTSDPMWNRGIMGATALLTQPTIDYYNHRVDEETRTVSRNRTIAKIIAGTLVGMFVVRGPVYKLVEKATDINGKKKYSKYLLPEKYIKELEKNKTHLMNYRATLAMALALTAMCITNFVLDAPLTTLLTNIFNEKSGIRKDNSNKKNNNLKKEEPDNV